MKKSVFLVLLLMFSYCVNALPSDVKWIKSANNIGCESNWEPLVSSSGKYLIIKEASGTHFINLETGNLEKIYNLTSHYKCASLNSDSVLVMFSDMLRVFDTEKDSVLKGALDTLPDFLTTCLGRLEYGRTLTDISPKLGLIAFYGYSEINQEINKILICDINSGVVSDSIFPADLLGLCFLEDRNELLYSEYMKINVYDLVTKKVKEVKNFSKVMDFVRSADGKLISFLSYIDDNNAKLTVASPDFNVLAEFTCSGLNSVNCFYPAFSPDNKLIAACNNDKIDVYDIAAVKKVKTIETIFQPNFLFFCDSGKSIIALNERAGFCIMYDLETGAPKKTLVANDDEINLMKFSPDGKIIVTYGHNLDRLKVIDAEDGSLLSVFSVDESLSGNDYPNYNLDVSNTHILFTNSEKEFLVVRIADGNETYIETGDSVMDATFSPTGDRYAVSTINGKVSLYGVSDNKIIKEASIENQLMTYRTGFSSDGNTIYLFTWDKQTYAMGLYEWYISQDAPVKDQIFKGTSNGMSILEFNNSKYIISRSFIYNIPENKYLNNFSIDYKYSYADISKDEKFIVFGQIYPQNDEYFNKFNFQNGNLIKKYDMNDYIRRKNFIYPEKYWIHYHHIVPYIAAFSPDNESIAVGLYDGALMMLKNDGITGIEEYYHADGGDGVTVYPNPFDDKISVKCENNGGRLLKAELFNAVGEKIIEKSDFYTDGAGLTFNTGSVGNGIYFLQLTFENRKSLKKIVRID